MSGFAHRLHPLCPHLQACAAAAAAVSLRSVQAFPPAHVVRKACLTVSSWARAGGWSALVAPRAFCTSALLVTHTCAPLCFLPLTLPQSVQARPYSASTSLRADAGASVGSGGDTKEGVPPAVLSHLKGGVSEHEIS